ELGDPTLVRRLEDPERIPALLRWERGVGAARHLLARVAAGGPPLGGGAREGAARRDHDPALRSASICSAGGSCSWSAASRSPSRVSRSRGPGDTSAATTIEVTVGIRAIENRIVPDATIRPRAVWGT